MFFLVSCSPLPAITMARFNLREVNPVTRTYRFFGRLSTNFGWRFVIVLLSAYIGVKGITSQLTYSAYLPYMRDYVGVTRPTEYQAFYTVSRLPWSLKATIGMVSDAFPIGGYYKRYYLLGAATFGSIACTLLAAAPIRKIGGGVTTAVLLFILTLEHASGASLLFEGELERRHRGPFPHPREGSGSFVELQFGVALEETRPFTVGCGREADIVVPEMHLP